MKKNLFAVVLLLLCLLFAAGCGGGSGDSETMSDATFDGSVSLAWEAPVGSDGMPVANVAGYTVHYGTSPGSYAKELDSGSKTSCTIKGLAPGTYYIAVTCYDSARNESTFSNEVSKTVQ